MTAVSLIDGFRRAITYLRVSVTDKCNLRCVYCMPDEGLPWLRREEILSYEEIAEIVRAAATVGVTSVRLTGGEPLVRRDLDRLVAAIAAVPGVDGRRRSRPTGCCWKTSSPASSRRVCAASTFRSTRCAPDRFEAIARRPGLDAVLRGIDAAVRAGLAPLKINCVVMRGQQRRRARGFAALTRELPVFVRFIEVMPVHENVGLQRDTYVSSDEILRAAGSDRRPAPGARSGRQRARALLCVCRRAPGAVGVISPLSHDYCERCNRVRLTADGRLRLCLFGDHALDLRVAAAGGGRNPRRWQRCCAPRCSSNPSAITSASGRRRRGCARSPRSAARRGAGHRARGPTVGENWEACHRADPTAIAQARAESLVLEYQTKLARYLRRMVGDAEVALDLSQDVFLSAYRMLKADPERELTAGWLYRAATNGAISFLRRKRILRMLPLDREVDRSTWRVDERSAASVDLQLALSRLPPEQSAALLLTSYAGYSSTEAASILGTTSSAVRQRVCRAMRVLRTVMKEGMDG